MAVIDKLMPPIGTAVIAAMVAGGVSWISNVPALSAKVEMHSKSLDRLEARQTLQEAVTNSMQATLAARLGEMERSLGRIEGALGVGNPRKTLTMAEVE